MVPYLISAIIYFFFELNANSEADVLTMPYNFTIKELVVLAVSLDDDSKRMRIEVNGVSLYYF